MNRCTRDPQTAEATADQKIPFITLLDVAFILFPPNVLLYSERTDLAIYHVRKSYKEARFEHISSVNNFIVFVNTPKTSKRTIESLGSFSASNFVHYFYARLS